MFIQQQPHQNEGELHYLYHQHGLTHPIPMPTQGTLYWMINIKYRLVIEWGQVSAQAGLLNTQAHPAHWWQQSKCRLMLMSTKHDSMSAPAIHPNQPEQQMKPNENKMAEKTWMWSDMTRSGCETEWNKHEPTTKTNPTQTATQESWQEGSGQFSHINITGIPKFYYFKINCSSNSGQVLLPSECVKHTSHSPPPKVTYVHLLNITFLHNPLGRASYP